MSLFIVFALARTIALWGGGRPMPWSAWAPLAYLWQDAAIALLFSVVFDRAIRRQWPGWVAYAALVAVAAVNVPVMHVLSSPITAPMLRATRGTLGDSFRYHATAGNVAALAAVIAAALIVPIALRRLVAAGAFRPWRRVSLGTPVVAGLGAVVLVGGPISSALVDTRGMGRNSAFALVRSAFPRVRAGSSDADFRASLDAGRSATDLTFLRGAAAGRDVVLVVLESTAARYLATYGASDDPMPHLSALAARSLVVDDAYAVYPESVKGLSTFLASRYPAFDVAAEEHARVLSPSIASVLRGAGYETALFHSGRFMYLGMAEVLRHAGFARLEDAGDIGGNRESSFGIDEPAAVDRLLGWIDGIPAGRRFFATYLPIAGHHPYASSGAGPYASEREIDRYRDALYDADAALGRLLAGLRSRGREESTLVVVVGDHGEAFGQHPGNYAHTLALFDENLRVPFVISAPGVPRLPARVAKVASLVDVPPTILDLLGVVSPSAFQGSSLLDGTPRAALFFTDYSLGLLGLRDGCRKFIVELESGRSDLFDVCRDPDEAVDISAANAELVAAYRSRLESWAGVQVAEVRRSASAPRD